MAPMAPPLVSAPGIHNMQAERLPDDIRLVIPFIQHASSAAGAFHVKSNTEIRHPLRFF